MKTFTHLIEEVQKPGLCHRCGGCVTFCTAINYGALELDEEGKPRFKAADKCIECGLCYAICPETTELDEDIKQLVSWEPPVGRVMDVNVARAIDPAVRARASDGGVVTALLLHLLHKGHIDGAIVTRKVGLLHRVPFLAATPEDILEAAGFHLDSSHGLPLFSELFSTHSPSMFEVGRISGKHLNRVAFVGTPCQVNTIRKIQALGIVPSRAIKIVLGLFCTGNVVFTPDQKHHLETIGNFRWDQVARINVKEHLIIHLHDGEVRLIPLDQIDYMKRPACRYCPDYSSEYADLSFGGLGAPEGWTTVVTRSQLGRSLLEESFRSAVETYPRRENPDLSADVLQKTIQLSDKKKQLAKQNRKRDLPNPQMA